MREAFFHLQHKGLVGAGKFELPSIIYASATCNLTLLPCQLQPIRATLMMFGELLCLLLAVRKHLSADEDYKDSCLLADGLACDCLADLLADSKLAPHTCRQCKVS